MVSKIDQRLASKMFDEFNDLPKWMTVKREAQAIDLANMVPFLLKRIYYLEKQLEEKS